MKCKIKIKINNKSSSYHTVIIELTRGIIKEVKAYSKYNKQNKVFYYCPPLFVNCFVLT